LKKATGDLNIAFMKKRTDIIIRVIDETTNEVIKEIPPEKILNIMASHVWNWRDLLSMKGGRIDL
jgi:uncharacterized FlaG/YvyC family protein